MNRTVYRTGLALITLGLAGLGIARMRPGNPAAITDYGQVPEFTLTESGGGNVTLQDLRGKVWIADFIFTSCAGTCPAMSSQMRTLQDELPEDIRMISFSVDPDRDTPAVLAKYAKRYGADGRRWMFLTGDRESLYTLSIKGFKLALEARGSDLEPITHSTRFVLIDRTGRIRGYYSGTEEEDLKRLSGDAKKLL